MLEAVGGGHSCGGRGVADVAARHAVVWLRRRRRHVTQHQFQLLEVDEALHVLVFTHDGVRQFAHFEHGGLLYGQLAAHGQKQVLKRQLRTANLNLNKVRLSRVRDSHFQHQFCDENKKSMGS